MEYSLENKFIGTILGGVIGDVLGSQTEGMLQDHIVKTYNGLVKYMPDGKKYTDDSEMTLVLLRHLVKNDKKMDLVGVHAEYANELINNKGYSERTRMILQQIKEGNYFISKGRSDHNGCIMRIAPLGLVNFPSDKKLINEINLATYFTHADNEASITCCFLHCKMINKLITITEPSLCKKDLVKYMLELSRSYKPLFVQLNLVKHCLTSSRENVNIMYELFGKVDYFQIKAIDCLSVAMYIFFKFYDQPVFAIRYAVSIGGDTDTIAKIVGDLMGALWGIEWIPEIWKGVENESEFISLARKLKELVI